MSKEHEQDRIADRELLSIEQPPHTSPFDAIRQVSKDGREYWSARDMSGLLGYRKWENFRVAVERAKKLVRTAETPLLIIFLKSGK